MAASGGAWLILSPGGRNPVPFEGFFEMDVAHKADYVRPHDRVTRGDAPARMFHGPIDGDRGTTKSPTGRHGWLLTGMDFVRVLTAAVDDTEHFSNMMNLLVEEDWRVASVGFDRGKFAAVMVSPTAMMTSAMPTAEAPVASPVFSPPADGPKPDLIIVGDEPAVPAAPIEQEPEPQPAIDDAAVASADADADADDDDDEFSLADVSLDEPAAEAADEPAAEAADDPGWYDDPSGRHAQRFWDGAAWTEHVADEDGNQSVDPPIA